jgi:hypothetical protein
MMSFEPGIIGIAMLDGSDTGSTPGVHTSSTTLCAVVAPSLPPSCIIAADEQSKLPSAPAFFACTPPGSVNTTAWCTTLRLPGTTCTPSMYAPVSIAGASRTKHRN